MPALSDSFQSSFENTSEKLSVIIGHSVPEANPTPAAPHKVGDCIGGKYEIFRILGGPGRSGMGIVYVVYANRERSVYALKTFQDKFVKSDAQREAFLQEALNWTRLERHPYIVKAHSVSEFSGRLYIALEYIAPGLRDRNCLTHYLGPASLPLDQILRWSIAFCYAMEHASRKGIVCHRDIKPDNIMISPDGTLKVTDFGMAAALEKGHPSLPQTQPELESAGHASLTLAQVGKGVVCGTPGYMAPEVLKGDGATIQSDIFSFGVVLFQMATGSRMSPLYKSWRDLDGQTVPPIKHPLWPTIARCLASSAGDRYADFRQLRMDLEMDLQKCTGLGFSAPMVKALDVGEWNGKGTALAALHRFEEAVSCYDCALEIDPRLTQVWSNKADALTKLGKLDEAVSCCDRALEINPLDATAWHSKGGALAVLCRRKEALDCYDQVLEILSQDSAKSNDETSLFTTFGKPEEELSNPLEAIARCNAALELAPNDAKLWYEKGVALKALGDTVDALYCIERALKIDPNYIAAQYNMAFTLHDLGKPKFVEVWGNKGIIFWILGEMDQAILCINKALDIDPWWAEGWYIKGNVLRELQELLKALHCYDRALEINPHLARAWNNKGKVCFALGWSEDVLPCFDRALELDPHDAETAFNMGVAIYYLGPPKQAISWFDRTLKIDPRHAAALFSKGNAFSALGQPTEALSCYEMALEINPDYFEAWGNRGQALLDLDRPQEAIHCFDRTLKINPTAAGIWMKKGNTHSQLGQNEAALASIDRALEVDPQNANAWGSKGITLAAIGRQREAAEAYRKFLSLAGPEQGLLVQMVQKRLRALESR